METAKGQPSAVKTWWYPRERIGYEFIYPKEQARRLARGNVRAGADHSDGDDETGRDQDGAARAAGANGSGDPRSLRPTPPPSAPTGASQTGRCTEAIPSRSGGRRSYCRQRRATLPLVGLIGLLALAGAARLRLWRMVRSSRVDGNERRDDPRRSSSPCREPSLVAAGSVLAIAIGSIGAAQESPVFKAESELVVLHVMVKDRNGSYVGGLTADAFRVLEENRPQTIASSPPRTHRSRSDW